jgi:hypothetical protein
VCLIRAVSFPGLLVLTMYVGLDVHVQGHRVAVDRAACRVLGRRLAEWTATYVHGIE